MSTDCDRAEERLLFAAGALGPAEREAFATHLAGCEACERGVSEAADALAETDAVEPGDEISVARVRSRLMERVHQDASTVASSSHAKGTSVRTAALAATAATLIAGGLGWLGHLAVVAPMRAQQAELRQQVATLEAERGRLERHRGDLEHRLEQALREVDLLRTEDLIEVPLRAIPATSSASARILWHAKSQRCYMTAYGLPHLPAGRRYVMWAFTQSGRIIRVGSFVSGSDGFGAMYGELPQGTGAIDRVLITDEPEALPASPSGAEHLAWTRQT